jgi:hypothetical protein
MIPGAGKVEPNIMSPTPIIVISRSVKEESGTADRTRSFRKNRLIIIIMRRRDLFIIALKKA